MDHAQLQIEWARERERANRYHGECHDLRTRLKDVTFQRDAAKQEKDTLITVIDAVTEQIHERNIKLPGNLLSLLTLHSTKGRSTIARLVAMAEKECKEIVQPNPKDENRQ
jgi:hypothetical protein